VCYRRFTLSLFCLMFSPLAHAQQAPIQQTPSPAGQNDSQAVAILSQSLAIAGWNKAVANPTDFEASGKITYFVEGQQLTGTATLKGRGSDQFRLDAELSQGTRSVVVDRGHFKLYEPANSHLDVPSIAVGGIGLLTNPYPGIAATLNDPRSRIAYVGTAVISGHQTHQISVMRPRPTSPYPTDFRLQWVLVDYFVDVESGLVLRLADSTYRVSPPSNFPHAIDFGQYFSVQGVLIPRRVSEKYRDADVWILELSDVRINSGVSESHFKLDE
jgi:hypothetical protein